MFSPQMAQAPTWVAADAAAAGSIYWTLTDEQLHPKMLPGTIS